MKLRFYGLSFCILVAAATLATLGFLPDAFSSAVAQQEQDILTPVDASPMGETPIYESEPAPPAIVLERNPFVSDDATASGGAPADQPAGSTMNPMAFAPEGGPAPNVPAAATPASEPVQNELLGVVVGERAFALVSDQGETRIVRTGDRFQGHTIARITAGGITFSDGSHATIPLPE